MSGCCWALTDSKNVHEQSFSSQYFHQSDSIIFTDTRAKDNLIFIAYLNKINVSVTENSRNLRLSELITVSWLYCCLITQFENFFCCCCILLMYVSEHIAFHSLSYILPFLISSQISPLFSTSLVHGRTNLHYNIPYVPLLYS